MSVCFKLKCECVFFVRVTKRGESVSDNHRQNPPKEKSLCAREQGYILITRYFL